MPHPVGPTTLYRLFASGELLYVGVAGNPGRRFEQHRSDKPWWGDVTDIKLEHFPDRLSALAAEREAIGTENPLHNVDLSPNRRRAAALRTKRHKQPVVFDCLPVKDNSPSVPLVGFTVVIAGGVRYRVRTG